MTAIRLVLCAAVALAVSPAGAMTAVEHRVKTATAPHLRLASAGKPVTVHYVHLEDDNRNNRPRAPRGERRVRRDRPRRRPTRTGPRPADARAAAGRAASSPRPASTASR
jgi:hypothetical protein